MSAKDVLLYIPNIIGYIRISLTLVSLWFMYENYVIAAITYSLAVFLDEFDGIAARKFNQVSQFGAMLDMLTDRCATMSLTINLACLYPKWTFIFQLVLIIDISSHWLHTHVALMTHSSNHKTIDSKRNPLLLFYYTCPPFLTFMVFGSEIFYVTLYLCNFTVGPSFLGFGVWRILCIVTAPIVVLKFIINLIQLETATLKIAEFDASKNEHN